MIKHLFLIREALSMRLCLIVLPLFFLTSTAWAQGLKEEWLRDFDTPPSGSGVMITSATDSEGNIYMAGFSEVGELASKRIVMVKYSPTGQLLWAFRNKEAYNRQIYHEETRDITIDHAGNVYVTGLISWRERNASEDSREATIIKLNAADGSQV
ncbi:NHL repeat-containing protein [Pontibacter virosus]|uniref:Beta-propeller repeat-containing protein n=1 Tax=Pontibacter virosus TaxID=1765052 RepID=A0A2U1ARL0_9BACT|nr:hypothetical protein [Pontibacter virosus]PVY39050.1 hypothetical protein C8E01_11337 [Pontibacter virosus]